ncbi:MAG TPA: bifunctional adenosylcobinamide kinase/adenosylcobinamide-phosphate guanylyltransferase [Streptosporangiaceae bacterium]
MELTIIGTGGARGWPEPGCPCASCAHAARSAPAGPRGPYDVLLDGDRLADGPPPDARTVPGGFTVARGGARLLAAGGPGAVPRPEPGSGPYDLALLDLAADPYALGALRAEGAVDAATRVVPVHLDHRWPSPDALARRLAQWGVAPVPDGTRLPVSGGAADTAAGPEPYGTGLMGRTLVTGGSRSGKSAEAELRVAAEPHVTYVATGPRADADPAWGARVAAHRARRPAHWTTEETAELVPLLALPRTGALLIDGIGTWLAATMDDCGVWDAPEAGAGPAHDRVLRRVEALTAAWRATRVPVVAVTDEVGGGLVPETRGGRYFRDVLGDLNQRLSAESERTVLVVAGRAVDLP